VQLVQVTEILAKQEEMYQVVHTEI